MNEVEIVVRSNDKTDVAGIGQQFRTKLNTAVKGGLNDVDKTIATRFRDIGHHGGTALSDGLKQGTRGAAQAVDGASVAARKMGLAVQEAADRASRAERAAAAAADRLKAAEEESAAAARAAAEAAAKLEQGEIKEAEAARLTAEAAKRAAAAEREKERATDAATRASRAAERADLAKAVAAEASGRAASSSAKKFGSATEGLAGQFKEMGAQWKLVGIVNGLALLPELASVAGGAITLGLGGALVGLAMKSQMANKQVKQDFANTKKDIVSEFSDISKPFAGVMSNMAHEADVAFSNIAPSLKKAFAEMAPATDRFMSNLIASFSQLDPAIESLGHAFARVTDSLGPHMGDIMHNVATGIKAITDATAKNPGAVTGLAEGIGKLIRYTGDGIGILIRFKNVFETAIMLAGGGGPLGLFKAIDAMVSLKDKVMGTSHALQMGGGQFKSFADQAASGGVKLSALDKDMKTLASDTASATDKANALSDAFNRLLNPAEAVFKDTANLRESIKAMGKALEDSKGKINDNSAAARASKQAFGGMIDNAKTLASDMLNSGKNITQVRAALQPTIAQMYAFAGSNQRARALVDDFVHSLDGMPDNKKIKLSLNAQDFFKKLHEAKGLKLDPKTGLLKGNNSDYLNKWLRTNHLRIDPKTGLLRGNNSDYYNKWLKANGLKINPKTGVIKGNTKAFWNAVHGIPAVVGTRRINVVAATSSDLRQGRKTFAHGGIVGAYATGGIAHAAEGGPRSNLSLVGEQGAELVRLPTGSTVIPHGQSMAMLGGMGGGELTVNMHVIGGGGSDFERMFMEMIRRFVRVTAGRGPNSVQKALG